MIKADIIKQVATDLKKKDKEALVIVDTIIDSMKETICKHQRLEIRDFGVFQIKQRKKRKTLSLQSQLEESCLCVN